MIISYSGKKRSGKDTAGIITQTLLSFPKADNETVIRYLDAPSDNPKWKIKKWAGYLKQIVAILTGCTVEDLEDEDKKNEVIYTKWLFTNGITGTYIEYEHKGDGIETYQSEKKSMLVKHIYTVDMVNRLITYEPIDITRRVFLERIGTEIGRNIHSMLWIDRLVKDYATDLFNPTLSQWIITDTRFPNEAETVRKLSGLNIRINRPKMDPNNLTKADIETVTRQVFKVEHESETALDNYTGFDYIINNDGTIDDLINRIRDILKHEKLINVE